VAFCADGGSAPFEAARKMYDAASLPVRFANTGPDLCPSDATAFWPRAAFACESGSHVLVALAVLVADRDGWTRAYQYQIPAAARRMTRQPSLLRQPNISLIWRRWAHEWEYP